MSGVLEQTLARAIKNKWIPQSDKQTLITRIQQMANKFGFDPNDFATFTHIESYGMNPAAWNGEKNKCAGIIQFCPNTNGGTTKTIGGKNYNTREILRMSAVQQMDLIEDYFEDVIPKSKRQNIDLGNLYFYVLYPGIGAKYASYSNTENIRRFVGQQASTFHNPDGSITKASVLNGIKKQAESNLNTTINPSQNIGVGGGADSNNTGLTSNNNSVFSGASFGTCSELFPIEFSLKEALHYAGCFSRQINPAMGSTSNLGFPTNEMQINGGSNYNIADFNPTVPICEGCLIFPFKKSVRITSPFCQRRISKRTGNVYYHSGTDYDGVLGDEVVAVADGTTITPAVTGGYNPGLVDIVHESLGNLVSRSAHIIPSVQPGTKVKQGDVIGKVGPYPSGGPHLHLELRKDKGIGGSARSEQECKTNFLDPALFCRKS